MLEIFTCRCEAPLVEERRNPMTNGVLILCADHATRHDEGHAFIVYPFEEEGY